MKILKYAHYVMMGGKKLNIRILDQKIRYTLPIITGTGEH
jgi:hypothetical protein